MYLRLKAPFAAFRSFQSGSYRSTTPIPSPSTVYGLLLNLAGIEQRGETTQPITPIRENLPSIELAIAIPSGSNSEKAIFSQQLHTYPVGSSGKDLAKKTYGAKYWIVPVRREVLVNLDIVVGVKATQELCDRILQGLNGELNETRYGVPFAGDNNFFFDEISVSETTPFARWYCPLEVEERPKRGVCRLTTWIDREDNTKTQTQVFVPSEFVLTPPDQAWISLPPP
ncbi:CRISPR-associated protein Cas5 [Spirulina sp. CS-785/01]|uniref:CRISPR-associated protein Cas5 n=1 Tax=Spirulina sp. CS-785/01 TaxID=3021716 RepID=UPI00232EBD60|nr:CRISPR-associated protein Cas5 [Spirulina sp. CS-785/01]MDB9311780.1 CRISPR-associated protein Cas5 [Spirulina sp. CS-785/01]